MITRPASRSREKLKPADDPWALVWGQPYIDCQTLAKALEADLERSLAADFRTRLLVRDCARAIRSFWGPRKFTSWLAASPVGDRIQAILNEDLGNPGFHFIRKRLVASTSRDQVEQVFELLGANVRPRIEVDVAGSIPTLLEGLTSRPTDDIDFVDAVPAEMRKQRAVLKQIKEKFGLVLGHVQAHYLPEVGNAEKIPGRLRRHTGVPGRCLRCVREQAVEEQGKAQG
jgi:hypothetical protein